MTAVTLIVNGASVTADVEPRTHLADFLREQRLLTGTHLGCEHGVCGACTVFIDGQTARSCISFAIACEGADVRTIESFDDDPLMIDLRAAFTRRHALQCGYCTPGMLATARDIALRLPDADEARVRLELSGNLCRCTGYAGIVRAILEVLAARRASDASADARATPAPRPIVAQLPPPAAPAPVDASVPQRTNPHDRPSSGVAVIIAAAPDAVWRVLRDPSAVAACLPGASLDSVAADGALTGSVAVAFGPIRARFKGLARVTYDDAQLSGNVTGGGQDSGGNGTQGSLDFRVAPLLLGSSLEATIAYRLTGPLAQFGRGALVEAFVQTLLEDFGKNIESRLAGNVVAQAEVGAFATIWRAALRRLKSVFQS